MIDSKRIEHFRAEPEQKYPKEEGYVPETLDWCKIHYVPVSIKHIHCTDFGDRDRMDEGRRWCMEMTPYQWHMCVDETWLQSLIKSSGGVKGKSRKESALFIENYKNSSFKKANNK